MKKGNFRKLNSVLVMLLLLANIILPSNIIFAKNRIPALSTAPLNSEFIKYQTEKNSELLYKSNLPNVLGMNQDKLGYIPPPTKDFFKIDKKTQISSKGLTSSSLPSKFDLRTIKNKLSPVRDQGNYGSCWAFATYGSLESSLRPSSINDFSEDNLMRTHGYDFTPNDGGNEQMSMAYLSKWSGAISESDDPYNTPNTPTNLKAQKHIQNADYITGTSWDNVKKNIKETLNNKGAIYTSMFYNNYFYDETNKSYFCDYGGFRTNHAVTIVGWDDNYSKNKFNNPWGSIPKNNGAFIIRNSWGSKWGEGGYFYISYEDYYSCLNNMSFNNAEPVNNYSSIYQRDPLGWVSSIGLYTNSCYAANVFTATSNQTLSATGFYTTAPNTCYEIKIYDTVNGGIFSGLKSTKSGTISNMGYHTVQLSTGVQLTSNKKFAVTIKLTTPGYNYPVAFETPLSNYSSNAKANSGESYLSTNGSTWYDLVSDYGLTNSNVCIKAFTKTVSTPVQKVLVTFNSQGGSKVTSKTTHYNSLITAPVTPSKTGYAFGGWYKEVGCLNAWNFTTNKVTSNITLYAKWITIPGIPTSVKASSSSYNSIKVSWRAVASASGYEVYKSTSAAGANTSRYATTATSYNSTGLTTNSTYYYKVRSYRMVGTVKVYGVCSAVISARPIPASPTNVKAARISSRSIKLTLSGVTGASGYEVYRATSSTGSYSLLTRTTYKYYTNSKLTTGRTYYYKIKSYRTVGRTRVYSNWSAVVHARP
ncbi:MAG: lectin like domain-containing protein [Clostridium sp.]|uniref:lectin like domain-containing protein n=1 Tax=Clostridium sp. TaxID=1506 RepID=UPI003D6CE614